MGHSRSHMWNGRGTVWLQVEFELFTTSEGSYKEWAQNEVVLETEPMTFQTPGLIKLAAKPAWPIFPGSLPLYSFYFRIPEQDGASRMTTSD